MKNFKLNKIANGIILLVSATALYALIITFIHILVAFNGNGHFWHKKFEMVIDKNDQKFLTENLYLENKTLIYDLNLQLLQTKEINEDSKNSKEYLDWTYYGGHSTHISAGHSRDLSSELSSTCIVLNSYFEQKDENLWYYLPKLKYFVGYSKTSKRVIGYFCTKGFSTTLENLPLFNDVIILENLGYDVYTVLSANKAYIIQFSTRKIISLQLDKEDKFKSIHAQFEKMWDSYKNLTPLVFIVSTHKKMLTYSPEGILLSSVLIQKDLFSQRSLKYIYNGKHYVCYDKYDEKLGNMSITKELSAEGETLWEYKFNESSLLKNNSNFNFNIAIPFMVKLNTNILRRFFEVDPFNFSENPLRNNDYRSLGDINFSFWMTLAIVILAMLFVYFHLVKRTDSKFTLYSWLLIILIFSLPGVIAYLICYKHIKIITCTGCGKKFLPLKNKCLFCSHEIPLGKTDGREIFSVS